MLIQYKALIVLSFVLPMLILLIVKIRQANVFHVYIVFYTLSLALTVVFVTILYAYLSSFIDGEGMPHGLEKVCLTV